MEAVYKLVLFVSVMLATVSLAAGGVWAVDREVSSCGILNESNTRYIITQDIAADLPTCFTIEGDSIELEGNGHIITDPGHSYSIAIDVRNSSDVSISNITTHIFATAIKVESSSDIVLRENNVFDSLNGFVLYNVTNSHIADNYFLQELLPPDAGDAIRIDSSSDNTIANMTLRQISSDVGGYPLGGHAIYSLNSEYNYYSNIDSSGSWGAAFDNSSHNQLDSIRLDDVSGSGVYMTENSRHNLLEGVEVAGAEVGIDLTQGSEYNYFSSIVVRDSEWRGIILRGSKNNIFVNTSILQSASIALTLWSESNNNTFDSLDIDAAEGGDLHIGGHSLDNVFVDSTLRNYSMIDGNIILRDSRFGQVRIIGTVTASGNISETFGFGYNEFRLNMSEGMQGHYFDVVLFGIPTGRTNYRMMRNGELCDPSICNAEGTLDTEDVVFMVYDDGRYSIASDAFPEPPAPAPENNGNSGGGGSSRNKRTTNQSSNPSTVIPLADTNRTIGEPALNETNAISDGDIAPITGGFAGSFFGKRPLWGVVVFIALAVGALFLMRMKRGATFK